MEELVTLISNFGFPIMMVIYLLTRFEKSFTQVIKSIEKLEDTIKEYN